MLQLADRAGLQDLAGTHVRIDKPGGSSARVRVPALVAGMITGADSIEDMALLRHDAMGRLFTGVRAPSTLGTFLRTFTFGHIRQHDAVASRLLINLCHAAPLPSGADQLTGRAVGWVDGQAGGRGAPPRRQDARVLPFRPACGSAGSVGGSLARGQDVRVAGADNWVTPHRFLPVDSDGAAAAVPEAEADVLTPCPGLGQDGMVHLFGLPAARNALCGMAAVLQQPVAAGVDGQRTCGRCLSAPPVERH